ncbi:hypothetical protein [Microcoleus sp. FACHB-68]|uniref:hypothetical protein n=1 Tax=Microcoleus sp. FACHB-68 TaxID=2692826 RepID=UPI001681DD03|nr:hypothetical protein [Microcoleus sp. FACHB-68]MBD1935972.1 hypothetical protein [Microcoleus sp. FACHB-68]
MNPLLKNYCVSVEFPDVSGAEHLEMLQMRDRVTEIESQLTHEEKTFLSKADRQLVEKAKDFYQELSRFVNLTERRKAQVIPPQRWWWYLDAIQAVKGFLASDYPAAVWVRESHSPLAVRVQQQLETEGLPQTVAYLEKCFNITDEYDRLSAAQNILAGGVTATNNNRDSSSNNDAIELLDLAESLLEKLEEFYQLP